MFDFEFGDLDEGLEHFGLVENFAHVIFAVIIESDDMSVHNLIEFIFVVS